MRESLMLPVAFTLLVPCSYVTLFNPKSHLLDSTFLLHFKSLMGAFGSLWVQ